MNYQTITTCNAAGWNAYGRRMAESFLDRWPSSVPLAVYAEGFDTCDARIDQRTLPRWLDTFKESHRGDLDAHGMARGSYDFRRDAVKFVHKVAAITDAASRMDDGILVWLDGDVTTHAPVTKEWLDVLFPGAACLAWLDRTGMYPECGAMLFRVRHPMFRRLMDLFRSYYETDFVFMLPETHDSYVLEHVVKKLSAPWHSLSGDARATSHPLARGPLAACLDHRKGPSRKAMAHSPEHRVLA